MKLFITNISKLSDEELMSRLIKSRDNKFLTELYNRYSSKLLGFLIKMFKGDVDKAQDFLQDIFVRVIEKKHLFNTDKKFYTWIFTIASNMCKTEFRKPYLNTIPTDEFIEVNLHVQQDNLIDKQIFKDLLKEKIHCLEYNHKAVFILRYNEKFSLKEIADITDASIGTVKSRLFYATKKITEQLKDYNPKHDNNLFNDG